MTALSKDYLMIDVEEALTSFLPCEPEFYIRKAPTQEAISELKEAGLLNKTSGNKPVVQVVDPFIVYHYDNEEKKTPKGQYYILSGNTRFRAIKEMKTTEGARSQNYIYEPIQYRILTNPTPSELYFYQISTNDWTKPHDLLDVAETVARVEHQKQVELEVQYKAEEREKWEKDAHNDAAKYVDKIFQLTRARRSQYKKLAKFPEEVKIMLRMPERPLDSDGKVVEKGVDFSRPRLKMSPDTALNADQEWNNPKYNLELENRYGSLAGWLEHLHEQAVDGGSDRLTQGHIKLVKEALKDGDFEPNLAELKVKSQVEKEAAKLARQQIKEEKKALKEAKEVKASIVEGKTPAESDPLVESNGQVSSPTTEEVFELTEDQKATLERLFNNLEALDPFTEDTIFLDLPSNAAATLNKFATESLVNSRSCTKSADDISLEEYRLLHRLLFLRLRSSANMIIELEDFAEPKDGKKIMASLTKLYQETDKLLKSQEEPSKDQEQSSEVVNEVVSEEIPQPLSAEPVEMLTIQDKPAVDPATQTIEELEKQGVVL